MRSVPPIDLKIVPNLGGCEIRINHADALDRMLACPNWFAAGGRWQAAADANANAHRRCCTTAAANNNTAAASRQAAADAALHADRPGAVVTVAPRRTATTTAGPSRPDIRILPLPAAAEPSRA